MPQRTDIFDLGALGLTSGEGRRLDLHVARRPASTTAAQRYAVEPELVPVRARRLPHHRQRLGAAAALRGRRSTARACAAWSPADPTFAVDSCEVHQPGRRRRSCTSPYMGRATSSTSRPGRATRSRSRCPAQITCRPDCAGLCPRVRREPQRGPGPRARPADAPASRAAGAVARNAASAETRNVVEHDAHRWRPITLTAPSYRAAHGRPQAEAVARAHDAAPRAAQDHRARGERLPAVPPAAAPAPRVPALRLLRRSRGRARRTTTITITTTRPSTWSTVTVAVDANGADLGPAEVARGAARAAERGIRVVLFGPAGRDRAGADGVEVVDAPVSIAKDPDPARAVRSHARGLDRAGRRGRRRRRAPTRSSPAARPARRWPPRCSASSARAACTGRRWRSSCPVPGAPFLLLDAGANVEVRPEHLVQFAHMGAAFMEVVMGVRRPRVALLSNGEEPTKGPEDVVAAHAALTENPGGDRTSSATSRASRSAPARPT